MRCNRLVLFLTPFFLTLFAGSPSSWAQQPASVPYFGPYKEALLSSIRPEGWLREYLTRQANGLTGHLEAAGHPFNSTGWYDTTMAKYGWVVYEQNAYWVDGMERCGALLDDTVLTARARKQINYVLNHPDPDGYLGPKFLKAHAAFSRWPHVVFFRALMAEYGKTHDPRIPEALRRHYLSQTDPHTSYRNVINIEIMLWTYAQTKDARLLSMAETAYAEYNRISSDLTTLAAMQSENRMDDFHGVTFNETAKLAAVLYLYTGKKDYLDAVEHAYAKVDRYYMLLDGVLSSTEGMRDNDPLQSHETCDIADYTWSLGYLLMATGNPKYADKIERACFNAAPGAVTKDFKALQYFSCPNQVIADRSSNHNFFTQGSAWMSYRPNPGTECCPGDVNRIMPNYAARMWMTDSSGFPVAALFGSSDFSFTVDSIPITVHEKTSYPFEEEVRFIIKTPKPVRFPLTVRIPGWCAQAQIIAGTGLSEPPMRPAAGQFVRIERVFKDGYMVRLKLPMHLALTSWPEGGMGIERGPIVYALPVNATKTVDSLDTRSTVDFPAWNMHPASPWNYALDLPDGAIEQYVHVQQNGLNGYPWDERTAPVTLRVPARCVDRWTLETDSSRTGSTYTPHLPQRNSLAGRLSRTLDTLTLVPYGCTLLRLSVFPLAGEFGRVAHRTADPEIMVPSSIGKDSIRVAFYAETPSTAIHYTLDGSQPNDRSPLYSGPFCATRNTVVRAQAFRPDAEPSYLTKASLMIYHFTPATGATATSAGLSYNYFEGSWETVPDFSSMKPASSGIASNVALSALPHRDEYWGMAAHGLIVVPQTGLYRFYLTSDDGSKLWIDGTVVVDNDGAHATMEKNGYALLEAGPHRIEVGFFQGSGGADLHLEVVPPEGKRQDIPDLWLRH